jgi:hypothetical protein
MVFGGRRRLRGECSYDRNNDHREKCIFHCYLLATRGAGQLRPAIFLGNT